MERSLARSAAGAGRLIYALACWFLVLRQGRGKARREERPDGSVSMDTSPTVEGQAERRKTPRLRVHAVKHSAAGELKSVSKNLFRTIACPYGVHRQ